VALVTANGLTAYDFQLRRPRVGAWHADMRVDTEEALSGRVDLVIDDGFRTFKGTAVRSIEFAASGQARVVAGAGGLGISATPKHYNESSLRIVIGDLLRTAGETLSSTSSSAVLATSLPAWTTPALPVGAVIAALMQAWAPTAAWRMLADGTFWVGTEGWLESDIDPATYEIMEEAGEEAAMHVEMDRPEVNPGDTFEGRRVSYVQDDVPQRARVQTRLWFEDAAVTSLSRMRESFAALVNASPPKFDYRGRYWARVVSQTGSTIDVVPEAAGVPDMGKVQLVGPAGQTTNNVVGGRVLVGWSLPDLKAYAEAFDGTESVGSRRISADEILIGDAEEPAAKATSLTTWLNSHVHAGVTVGAGVTGIPTPPITALDGLDSTKVKV
jgi:hypothetical protein